MPLRGARRAAGVGRLELQPIVTAAQAETDLGRPARMLEGVRQGLLRDPKRRELDSIGKRMWISLDDELHGNARRAHTFGQTLQLSEPRLWLERLRRALVLQDAEQPSHLDQRVAPRR
jgi:hypothetical protein